MSPPAKTGSAIGRRSPRFLLAAVATAGGFARSLPLWPSLLAVVAGLAVLPPGCSMPRRVRPPAAAPPSVLAVAWRRQLTEPTLLAIHPEEYAAPAVDARLVFVGSNSGWFRAVRRADGSDHWRLRVGGSVSSRPLFQPETRTVYFGADDGRLYAVDADRGTLRWWYATKGPIVAPPALDGDLLFFQNAEDRVYALEWRSGKWRWQYDRELPDRFTIHSRRGPLAVGDRVYAGFADGHLTALKGQSGEVIWTRSLASEGQQIGDITSTPVLDGDSLYASSVEGGLSALTAEDGSIRWRFEVEGAGTVRVDGDRLFFAAPARGIHALDRDGQLLWAQGLAKAGDLSRPWLVGGQYLAFAARDTGLYLVQRENGALVEVFRPGRGISAEVTVDGRDIYFLSNGGHLYALRIGG